MAKRDFDTEFSQITSQLAAEDPELVEHYQTKMLSDEQPETSDDAIEVMICHQYQLEEVGYRMAKARVVGRIAGVQLGSEVFSGKT